MREMLKKIKEAPQIAKGTMVATDDGGGCFYTSYPTAFGQNILWRRCGLDVAAS